MPRPSLVDTSDEIEDGGNYFTSVKSNLEFVSSGCALLDSVLGGGWVLGRFANLVGDSSTGKTLLAIEACANFARQYPNGRIYYRESEAAFDNEYAEALGMPIDKVEFIDPENFATIEDYYKDLEKCVEILKKRDVPGIYIADSIDGLSDEAELKRDFDEGTYGMGKAKQMHKLFRMVNSKVSEANMCHIAISQTKDNVNAGLYAKKTTRSGGRALDFWASQILWLSASEKVTREITMGGKKVKRVTGVEVRARCEKNKISLPYRECNFRIMFGSGIDSLDTSLEWLKDVGRIDDAVDDGLVKYRNELKKMSDEDYWKEVDRVDCIAKSVFKEIEEEFLEGTRRKYRNFS